MLRDISSKIRESSKLKMNYYQITYSSLNKLNLDLRLFRGEILHMITTF